MNPVDTVPLMLLALHVLALGVVATLFIVMIVLHRRAHTLQQAAHGTGDLSSPNSKFAHRPAIWLAVRSCHAKAVQAALGVSSPTPCPWVEGLAGGHEFFIGPPVNGWIIVTGSGLPQPGLDVDRCFHFLIRLSRGLGEVQFFMADPLLRHHAWARVEKGVVRRAYAWANGTVWNQGARSLAEIELNLKCFGYGEDAGVGITTIKAVAAANVEKVSELAARWSINPLAIHGNLPNPTDGIAGQSSRFYRD